MKLLRKIGVELDNTKEKSWQTGYQQLIEYCRKNNTAVVPATFKTEDGYPLGEWLRTQVKYEASGILKSDRKAKLDKLGVNWKREVQITPPNRKPRNERAGITA